MLIIKKLQCSLFINLSTNQNKYVEQQNLVCTLKQSLIKLPKPTLNDINVICLKYNYEIAFN